MNKLPKYNSQALKEAFPEVYKKFFSTCTTVVSAPGNFMWGSNYAALFGCLSLRQNLPFRLYVGFEEQMGGEVSLGKFIYFSPPQNFFVSYEINQRIKEKLLVFLKNETKKIAGGRFKGLKVNILSEIQPGCGLGASSAFAAAISGALFLHYHRISADSLKKISTLPTTELSINENFDRLFRLAWKIDAIFHGFSSGIGAFASLINSSSPIILYFIKSERDPLEFHYSDIGKEDYLNYLDKLSYVGIRLEELIGTGGSFILPFEYGIINTGPGRLLFFSNPVLPKEFALMLNELAVFFRSQLGSFFKAEKIKGPLFADLFNENKIDHLWSGYLILMAVITLNILKGLIDLNKKTISADSVRFLFKNLNDFQSMLKILGVTTPLIDYLSIYLDRKIRKLGDEYGIGVQQLSTDKGGGVLFAFASQRLKDYLPIVIDEFRKETGEEVYLSWLSWRDGLEDKGLIIEQSLTSQIYSDFISRGALQVLHLDKWGCHEDLYTLEEFSRVKKEMEVTLDSLNGEIWIKGEKITSKELRTATHTLSVLRVLLENIKTEIPKTKLPSSGYLKDRNEFQSKIATPLVQVIEKRLGRRISFNVKGPIINFTVNFDPKDVEFHYIEKEF